LVGQRLDDRFQGHERKVSFRRTVYDSWHKLNKNTRLTKLYYYFDYYCSAAALSMAQKALRTIQCGYEKKTIISHHLPQWLCYRNGQIKITMENARGKLERTATLWLSIIKVSMWFILCAYIVHSDRYIYIYILWYRYIR